MNVYQERRVEIGGLRVNYAIAGEGTPVLVLHGWGGSSVSWVRVQELLALQGYRVVVPDLPGFGETPAPQSVWRLEEYMSFVSEFSKAVGLSQFFLVGHSFGGKIAVKFAVRYTHLLQGLVLVDSAGIPTKLTMKAQLVKRSVKIGKVLLSPRIFSWAREFLKSLLYVLIRNSDYAKAKGIMKEIMKEILKENIFSDLPSISMPTLILWGEKDRITPVQNAYVFEKNIPGALLRTFPNVGHSPHLKIPKECTSAIADFFKQHA